MSFTRFVLLCVSVWSVSIAMADVGVVVYESKGVDSRRNNSGHIALIATNLCANGIDEVRRCNDGEEPGVVMTRYLNLAYGYDRYVFVAPIRDHFYATSDAAAVPLLSSDASLQLMQIAYWRDHLRSYLPPLSKERYQELRRKAGDVSHTLRGVVSLETVLGALEAQGKDNPLAPVALMDPLTKELIPDGHWRQAIGAAHLRSSMVITAPATAEQEERLISYVSSENKVPFQALADNCSDFVQRGLAAVYKDSGLKFRPRIANVADIWVTNPLPVASDFIRFANRESLPLNVEIVPMLPGTRPSTAPIRSMARGVFVPDANQGKLIFGLKVGLNVFNPLFGATAFTIDKLSHFADLQRLAHERVGSGESSRSRTVIADASAVTSAGPEPPQAIKAFGTTSCWKAKEDQFANIAARAHEADLLTTAERALLLKRDRPFLFARQYEKTAGVFGPGRDEVARMAESSESRLTALRAMMSAINYELLSSPLHRPSADGFDRDWALFLNVAEQNGIHIAASDPARETLSTCSCREFADGLAKRDALADTRGLRKAASRQVALVAHGRNR